MNDEEFRERIPTPACGLARNDSSNEGGCVGMEVPRYGGKGESSYRGNR